MNFDLSEATERFRAKSPYGSLASDLELETRRFLKLAATSDQDLVPSDIVDEYWHALIIETNLYRAYCHESFGKFLHHRAGIPSSETGKKDLHQSRYLNTVDLYIREFGSARADYWPVDKSNVEQALKQYKNPHRLHLETTNHCNLHCEHCYPGSTSDNPHHAKEDLFKVIDQITATGAKKLTLTGGEILTHPDWREIVSYALDKSNNIYLITNATLLTDKKLAWLSRQKALRSLRQFSNTFFKGRPVEIGVAISLDGLNGHELVRKNSKGAPLKYEQTLERIRAAAKYGLHVTVNTTITNAVSAQEIPRMYDILSDIGIDRWQIDEAYLAGRYVGSKLSQDGLVWLEHAKNSFKTILQRYLANPDKLPNWRLEIVGVFRWDQLHSGFMPAKSLQDHPCGYQFGSVIVEHGSTVRFCPSLRALELGSLQQQTLDEIYETSLEFKDFLNHGIKDLPCKDCRYGLLYMGGCRANSFAYNGKVWDRDPICCSLSPFVEKEIVPLLPKRLQDQFLASLQAGPAGAGDRPIRRVISIKAKV